MTSKEALKWLYVYLTCDYCPMNSKCDDNNKWKCVECKEIIEKDLDKLEKFAHENASLHTKCESLHTENAKLKKVIEILKDILELPLEDDFDVVKKDEIHLYRLRIKCLINEEEYDLLKEYL